jgi:hypothetical protein
MKGLSFVIDKKWNGDPVVDHEPYAFHLQWIFQRIKGKPHKRAIKVGICSHFISCSPRRCSFKAHCSTIPIRRMSWAFVQICGITNVWRFSSPTIAISIWKFVYLLIITIHGVAFRLRLVHTATGWCIY